MPEDVAIQQLHGINATKRSKDRLNDQLIPKPTDINITEYKLKAVTPKEHPYSSHISRFAMFPSFHSPDDSDTGVRVSSQPDLNPLIPAAAPGVTLLSKTKGGPYRHEILEPLMKSRKKAVMWTGEHGFLNHTKPFKGECQVFYPSPPKTVFPNPKLWKWDVTLSERTSNMLKNLKETHWLTSYQMDYTGLGPTKLFKKEDFKEKMSDPIGTVSHLAPLRQSPSPVFVPSEPREACRRSQYGRSGRNNCSPTAAELPNPAPSSSQRRRNNTVGPGAKGLSESRSGSAGAGSAALHREVLHNQQALRRSSASKFREKENCKVHFDQSVTHVSTSQSSQEAPPKTSDTQKYEALHDQPVSQRGLQVSNGTSTIELHNEDNLCNKKHGFKAGRNSAFGVESHADLLSRVASKEEIGAFSRSISNSCIPPRPPVLPNIHPLRREGATVGCRFSSILDLQDSFSKSEAHRSFNSSVTGAAVDMRDNISTGKKHHFYGINCYYLHG